jgi:TolB-like protein
MRRGEMKTRTNLLGIIIAAVTISGCANSSNYHRSSNEEYERTQLYSNQRYVVDEPLGVQRSQTSVGRFNSQMIFMADQIERNADRKSLDNTFIVTSFTNLNKLSETTAFGRLIAENAIHELQVRKWKVFEVRLTKDIVINETGEFTLSRDIKKIKELYKVGGIVTGTYSVAGNHVIVNARVIDINTGLVASSAQIHMPVNWFTDALLFNEESLKPMKIVGDTPYSCRDSQTCWNGDTTKAAKSEGAAH